MLVILFPTPNSNLSLLTLSRVITALGQHPSNNTTSIRHIGYRDSKLTRVLQPSLSGNAKLAFVCCTTASGLYLEETKSTLQFAQRIKHVKTASKINLKQEDKSEIIQRLQGELNDTQHLLVESIDRIRQLETENKALKASVTFLSSDRDRALEKIQMFEKKMKENELMMRKNANNRSVNVIDHGRGRPITPEKATSKRSLNKDSLLLKSSGDIQAANNDLKNQVGFLSTVVEKLQGKDTVKKKDDAELNGMPSRIITAGSKKSIVSEVTEPSQYGTHVDEDGHNDAQISNLSQSLLSVEESKQSSSSSLLSKGDNIEISHHNVIPQEYIQH